MFQTCPNCSSQNWDIRKIIFYKSPSFGEAQMSTQPFFPVVAMVEDHIQTWGFPAGV